MTDLAEDTGQPDPTGKIQKRCRDELLVTIGTKCPNGLSVAFPGWGTEDPVELAGCLDQIVECRMCLALNAADGFDRSCDPFGDGQANSSWLQIEIADPAPGLVSADPVTDVSGNVAGLVVTVGEVKGVGASLL